MTLGKRLIIYVLVGSLISFFFMTLARLVILYDFGLYMVFYTIGYLPIPRLDLLGQALMAEFGTTSIGTRAVLYFLGIIRWTIWSILFALMWHLVAHLKKQSREKKIGK